MKWLCALENEQLQTEKRKGKWKRCNRDDDWQLNGIAQMSTPYRNRQQLSTTEFCFFSLVICRQRRWKSEKMSFANISAKMEDVFTLFFICFPPSFGLLVAIIFTWALYVWMPLNLKLAGHCSRWNDWRLSLWALSACPYTFSSICSNPTNVLLPLLKADATWQFKKTTEKQQTNW